MNVLTIADPHFPFVHPAYLDFCVDMWNKWNCDTAVFIGDVIDGHALSFHEHDPDGMSPGDECIRAEEDIQQWHATFPEAKVCIGNHDARALRLARKAGIPMRFLRDFADVWGTPGWDWGWEHVIDGVCYLHGTGNSGKDAAINLAVARRESVVIGHTHTHAGVKYNMSRKDRIFGMNVGCGINCHTYAMAYARDFKVKPSLGCGVTIDGSEAHFIPMPCGPGEKYHRDLY
jgi:hypothetical protein